MSLDKETGGQSSDPLPFVQVDRAVFPKAAMVANAIGVTNQHALGSLIGFWGLCGDPREIEKLLVEGKDEVILPREEVAERFEIAAGKRLEPERMARIGLLEDKGEGLFRVRGMSRFFKPIRDRLIAREKGRAGGLASAKVRAEKHGSSQPNPSKNRSERPSETGSEAAQAPPEPTPKLARSSAEAQLEADAEPVRTRGQRSEDRGHLKTTTTVVVVEENSDPLWELIQKGRKHFGLLREAAKPAQFDEWRKELDARGVVPEQVDHALALYLRDQDFKTKLWPTGIFITPGVFLARLPAPPKKPDPCEACGGPSDGTKTWGRTICYPCFAEVMSRPQEQFPVWLAEKRATCIRGEA